MSGKGCFAHERLLSPGLVSGKGVLCSREAAVAWSREQEGAFCSREGLYKAVSAVTETEGWAGKRKDMNSDLADRLADRAEGGF